MNCWEYNKCGRERGGLNAKLHGVCPAWPDYGQQCARVAGTFCGGKVQGTFVIKLLSCMKCDFYQSEHYDKTYRKKSCCLNRTTAAHHPSEQDKLSHPALSLFAFTSSLLFPRFRM
uniref:two-CW domain-containing protein n=1 Tax=Candidatus Electronema sp. TaxID=2698783 RepID=UPI00405727D9